MRQLVRCWLLEAGRDGTYGVDWAEDPPNGAILATRVQTLQNHQKRIPGLGIENFLQAVDFSDIGSRRSFGFRSSERYRFTIAWIDL